jgi:hypothetical protein
MDGSGSSSALAAAREFGPRSGKSESGDLHRDD